MPQKKRYKPYRALWVQKSFSDDFQNPFEVKKLQGSDIFEDGVTITL